MSVGGVTVKPGDRIHGDKHGVHTIPVELAEKVPAAAAQVFEREHVTIDYCRSPDFTLEGLKKLARG